MARNNKQAQGCRRENGYILEKDVRSSLQTMLEEANLDADFTVSGGSESFTYNHPEHGLLEGDADTVIRRAGTGDPVIGFGYKASLKDRRKQDYWCSLVWKLAYPGRPWFEVTRSEKPSQRKTSVIRRQCENSLRGCGSLWESVVSVRDSDAMDQLFKEIESILRKYLT